MLARQRTSGQGERCTMLRKVPAENPRIAPNIINFFILPRTPKRCLAEGLPAPEKAENGPIFREIGGSGGFRRWPGADHPEHFARTKDSERCNLCRESGSTPWPSA